MGLRGTLEGVSLHLYTEHRKCGVCVLLTNVQEFGFITATGELRLMFLLSYFPILVASGDVA